METACGLTRNSQNRMHLFFSIISLRENELLRAVDIAFLVEN